MTNPLYIGMMSGTSLDGLDVVLCCFDPLTVVATHTELFSCAFQALLLALCRAGGVDALPKETITALCTELSLTDPLPTGELEWAYVAQKAYARLCVRATKALLKKADKSPNAIHAIGVHGQTVRHQPTMGISIQLIDPNYLCEHTGITTVSDFRRRDMAVGGQGAPLVPIFHQYLAQQATDDEQVVFLNLGGIANISVIGGDTVSGYDTGVANLLMDGWIKRHKGADYDKGGAWAKRGAVDLALLDELLTHPFLAQSPPKSTGREAFHLAWLDDVLQNHATKEVDVQATLCEFTAVTASQEINKHGNGALFVCGGGAYNQQLMARLMYHLPKWRVATTQALKIAPTWVEAVCFAYLARETLAGRCANVPKVTGASRQVLLGVIANS